MPPMRRCGCHSVMETHDPSSVRSVLAACPKAICPGIRISVCPAGNGSCQGAKPWCSGVRMVRRAHGQACAWMAAPAVRSGRPSAVSDSAWPVYSTPSGLSREMTLRTMCALASFSK
jgi:hypothetical protein